MSNDTAPPFAPRNDSADAGAGRSDDRSEIDPLRAEVSDLRRAMLLRQEREALAVLIGQSEASGSPQTVGVQHNLALRTDLLELSILKLARELNEVREAIARLSGQASSTSTASPTALDELAARVESLEAVVLKALPGRAP